MRRLLPSCRAWALFLLLLGAASGGETGERITAWRASDGLPQSGAIGLTLSPRGRVLVTHSSALPVSRLDGFQIALLTNSVGAESRVYESRSAQLWCATSEGLLEQTGSGWNPHPLEDIAAEYRASPMRTVRSIPLLPLDRNRVLILLHDRLIEYEAAERQVTVLRTVAATGLERFTELAVSRDDGVWVSGLRGLLHLPGPLRKIRPESSFEEYLMPASFGSIELQRAHETMSGEVVLSADDPATRERWILRFAGGEWRRWNLTGQNIRQAWSGPDGDLWAQTSGALLRIETDGTRGRARVVLQAGRIGDIAVEANGAAWLATSEGVYRVAPLPWRADPRFDPAYGAVLGVAGDRRGRVVVATERGIHWREGDAWKSITLAEPAIEESGKPERILFPLEDGGLLVRRTNGIVCLDPEGHPRPLPSELRHCTPLGALQDGRVLLRGVGDQSRELLAFDGNGSRPFAELPDEVNALGDISLAFQTRSGELWVGGESGVLVRRGARWTSAEAEGAPRLSRSEAAGEDGVLAALELADGRLLLGGTDSLREFDGRRWTVLRRGLDRVHSLQLGREGEIWVSSGTGLHRYKDRSWLTLGEEEGLPASSIYSVFQDGLGRLWAGTARGLSTFDVQADTDAPQALIASADVPERAGDLRALFVVGGEDRWRYSPAGRLLFSSRLDGEAWTLWRTASSVQFTNVAAGSHRFEVRSMDPSGNIQARPEVFEFAVALPWFRDPRLVGTSAALALVVVMLAAQAVLSYLRLKRSYAEVGRQVAERSAALEKANAELLHNQKMRALGTLAAGVAHDFNNLLSIIRGSAQLAEGQLEDRDKARQRLQRIKTAVDQGAGLVKAMLGYSRGSAAPRRLVEVKELVGRVVRLFEESQEGNVEFTPPDGPLPRVNTSPEMLQQIILNLLQNAVEAADRAQPVRVDIEESSTPPIDSVLKPGSARRYVIVSIRDRGIGIPGENLARIFEPFFTTKALSSRRGTGLGLSMAYEFAKELEAGLAVESSPGQGSVFRILLPVPG